MKNKMIPDYPIMYKMNFTNGRLMKFQFDDFLFLYVYSGEGTICVSGINHPLKAKDAAGYWPVTNIFHFTRRVSCK